MEATDPECPRCASTDPDNPVPPCSEGEPHPFHSSDEHREYGAIITRDSALDPDGRAK